MTERAKTVLAVYLLLERRGDVLLIRRRNSGWQDGRYTLVAGHVDAGEPARAAMAREAQEEVGVSLDETDLELVHAMHRSDRQPYLDLYFRCSRWSGEPQLMEPDKADDLLWAERARLPDKVIDSVRRALGAIDAGQTYSEDGWPDSSPRA